MPHAILPPSYFPGLDVCAVWARAERVVLADTFAYARQGTYHRARLRTPPHAAPAWQWLTVPLLSGQRGRPLDRVEIDDAQPWRRTHLRTLRYHYGSAPFYFHYAPEVEALLARPWPSLGALAAATCAWTHGALGLRSEVLRASECPARAEGLAALVGRLRPEALVTLPAAAAHDRHVLAAAGRDVPVTAVVFEEPERRQNFEGWEAGMSALDLLMNFGPDALAEFRRGLVDPEAAEGR